jgi:hypothetical protein
MIPIRYYIQLDEMGLSAVAITAKQTSYPNQWRWIIEDWHDPGTVFSKSTRQFVWDGLASNRTEEHIADTRFASSEEALEFWNRGKS